LEVDPLRRFADQTVAMRMTPVPTYLCPSRDHEGLIAIDSKGVEGVKGDFVAVSGTVIINSDDIAAYDGAIIAGAPVRDDKGELQSWSSRTNYSKLTDGLSKTFLVMEAAFYAVNIGSIYDGDCQMGGILGDENYPEDVQERAAGSVRSPVSQVDGDGEAWAGSAHPTIFHVAMGDGSSHAIRKDADLAILEHFVTRSGNESTALGEVSSE
jgi:hypothetical protein